MRVRHEGVSTRFIMSRADGATISLVPVPVYPTYSCTHNGVPTYPVPIQSTHIFLLPVTSFTLDPCSVSAQSLLLLYIEKADAHVRALYSSYI